MPICSKVDWLRTPAGVLQGRQLAGEVVQPRRPGGNPGQQGCTTSEGRLEDLTAQVSDLSAQLTENRHQQKEASLQALVAQEAAHQELARTTKQLEDLRAEFKTCKVEHQSTLDRSTRRTAELEEELEAAKLAQTQIRTEAGNNAATDTVSARICHVSLCI
ncbi:hypothetical protein PGTUg99_034992 [Puccinia graminis f. sp. tritici]|uniref:Uncharacterized protein n=1 Tax=Puccinia graminis f. sp. tritici TaxID=56615 RepID=A0A5B0PND6_PUCGR|nr:hypothetical protein PGTUg99_034992 [Puccinia graminis f. sp. tritici]